MRKAIGILTILLGIVSCCLFFSAGMYLNNNGDKMMQTLKSKGGESVAEFYYQDVGAISSGLGGLCFSLGVGTFAISLGLGTIVYTSKNNIKRNEKNM